MKSPSLVRDLIGVTVIGMIVIALTWLLYPAIRHQGLGHVRIKIEMAQLVAALENCRSKLGNGQYPPASTDDDDAVKQFLAKAFPKYRSGLTEKYRNLDAASSLVFWLGGVADKDGKLIGFSADAGNPFDATNAESIYPFLNSIQKDCEIRADCSSTFHQTTVPIAILMSIFVRIPKASTAALGKTATRAVIQKLDAG